jgi:hypothetical protein
LTWTGTPTSQDVKSLSVNINPSFMNILNCRKKINKEDFFPNKLSTNCLDLLSKML